jgi:hypothetical protein
MKFLISLALAATVACAAPQTNHVNVASVRDGIKDAIAHDDSNPRAIVSMGHTTSDSAVVFTQSGKAGPRHEESWARSASGWTLQQSTDLTATAN